MKSLKNYLTEASQEFNFKIKLAKEISEEDLARIERHLVKYDITSMSAPKKLMLQSTPYDFPQLRGYEIIDNADAETTSVLADPDYKDAPEVNHEDYYGDKYNEKFLETLGKLRKEKEKAKDE